MIVLVNKNELMVQTGEFIDKGVIKISAKRVPNKILEQHEFNNTNFMSFQTSLPKGQYILKLTTTKAIYIKVIEMLT